MPENLLPPFDRLVWQKKFFLICFLFDVGFMRSFTITHVLPFIFTENRVEGESHDKPAKHKKPGKTSEDTTQKERKEDGRGRKKRKKKKRVKEKDDGIVNNQKLGPQ